MSGASLRLPAALGMLGALLLTPLPAAQMIEPPSRTLQGDRWAVLVAIDAYRDQRVPQSKGVVRASKEIASVLERRYGFHPSHIIQLYDGEATSARIADVLRRLASVTTGPDTVLAIFNLASLDPAKEATVSLVPFDSGLDRPWTLIPVPQVASSLLDLPADAVLSVFTGCSSRWEFALRRSREPESRAPSPKPPVKYRPPRPGLSREFVTICPAAATTVSESQANLVLKWLLEDTPPGERRKGTELKDALAGPLWSVELTTYGRAPGYDFIPTVGHSDDLAILTDTARSAEERGDALERLTSVQAASKNPAEVDTTINALVRIADSPVEPLSLQQRSVLALGQLAYPHSADALARLAAQGSPLELSLTSVRALGSLPEYLAIPRLETTLLSSHTEVQRSALSALVSLRARGSTPKIVTLLRVSDDPQVRLSCLDALQALGMEGSDALPTLAELARDDAEPELAAAALRLLSQTEADFRLELFRERLNKSGSPMVRRAAVLGLASLKALDLPMDTLLGALSDQDPGVREAVVTVLGTAKITRTRQSLIRTLQNDPSPAVRTATLEALGRLGDPSSIPPLQVALSAANPDERRAAASALGRLVAVDAFSDLVRVSVQDDSPPVRAAAESALHSILRASRFERARVDPALTDRSGKVQAAALNWLARSGDELWLSRFEVALGSDDESVWTAALDGLAVLGTDRAAKILATAAYYGEGARRDQAQIRLARIRASQSLGSLLELAGSDRVDPAVIEALGGFTEEEAIAKATSFTEGSDPRLRLAGARALQRQAQALHERGDSTRAITLGEKALATKRAILGHNHPEVAGDLNNLGVMYLALQLLNPAEKYLSEALDIRGKTLTPDPGLATTLSNLGTIAVQRRDYKLALDRYFQALDIRDYLLGNGSEEAISTLLSIADVYEKMGDPKAAALYRRQAETNRQKPAPPRAVSAD